LIKIEKKRRRRTKLIVAVIIFQVLGLLSAAQAQTDSSVTKRRPSFTDGGAESCLHCHSGEKMRAVAANPHGNRENPRSPASNYECESCHGAGSIHASRAHGGRGFPPLLRFGRGAAFSPREEQLHACLACHSEEGTSSQLIEFFGSHHDKSNINCSTCHKVHVEADPINDRDQQMRTCFRCHRKMRDEHPDVEGKSVDFDTQSCWTCHDVHNAPTKAE